MRQRQLGQLVPRNCTSQVGAPEVAPSGLWQNEGPRDPTWPCDHDHSERKRGQAWEIPGCFGK